MGRWAWALGVAAILLPAAPTCIAEGGKKAPPVPPPKPADPGPGLAEVDAALDRRNWAGAAHLADVALARKPESLDRLSLLQRSALANTLSGNFVGCLHRTAALIRDFGIAGPAVPERAEFVASFLSLRAEALLGLGREEDARGVLAQIPAAARGAAGLDRLPYVESVLRSSGPTYVDLAYEGMDRNHPELEALKRTAVESLPKAMHRVRFWLEAPDLEFPPLVLRFADDDWHGNEESSAAAWATSVVRSGTVIGVVTVGVKALLEGQFEGNGILAHELGHTLRYKGSPDRRAETWLEEGIAHWISGDIDLELPDYVLGWRVCPAHFTAGGGWPEFPLRSIPETEAGVAALGKDAQRLCGVLFFEHVERRRGIKNMRKLVRALLSAEDPSSVIREETGKSVDEHFQEVSRGLAAWEGRAWYEFDELEEIRGLLHRQAWAEAEGKCRAFIAAHTATKILPVAKRGLFLALQGQGKAIDARRVLDDAIAAHEHSAVHPWLLLEDLRLARQAGNGARVLELGRRIQAERTNLDDAARKETMAAIEEAAGGGAGKK
jgi:hypothetical protein